MAIDEHIAQLKKLKSFHNGSYGANINFAIEISDVCENIKGCHVYINQLVKCSSSIGANLRDAK